MTVFDTIFWDWNGTLLDDVAECIEIINISLKKRSLQPLDLASYLEKFEFPIKKYYENIGFDFSRESYEEAGKEYIKPTAAACLPAVCTRALPILWLTSKNAELSSMFSRLYTKNPCISVSIISNLTHILPG